MPYFNSQMNVNDTNLNINLIQICITSLTPPLFIEIAVKSQERQRSCIYVLLVLILPLSTIFL